ncbi:hypothetical protein [Agromyces allii]|uniref:Uncharacterized protein n=1 Tax=Agromyces allii TaxID=393607 RepID=A0ABN2QYB7_9MICO|nr:hypothetical protein [Agromyces allii]
MASQSTPQTSVWYFVGATFSFVLPSMLLPDGMRLWAQVLGLVLGFALLITGLVVFVREQRAGRTPESGPAAQGEHDPR